MPENENLLLRLRQGVDGYSRTQQKLGEFVLSDPAKVVYLTITELARESDTSEASVTRLCRTLGCKGYNEFKMALALDLQHGQPIEHGGDEIDNVVNESVQALQDTAKLLDRTLLEAAALALHQPSRYRFMAWRPVRFWGNICITNCYVWASPHNCSATCIVPP